MNYFNAFSDVLSLKVAKLPARYPLSGNRLKIGR